MGFVGGRGTSRRPIKELKSTPVSGESYKEYQKQQKDKAKDTYITTGRGTQKIRFGDMKAGSGTTSAKGRYVSVGRGTGRRKVE